MAFKPQIVQADGTQREPVKSNTIKSMLSVRDPASVNNKIKGVSSEIQSDFLKALENQEGNNSKASQKSADILASALNIFSDSLSGVENGEIKTMVDGSIEIDIEFSRKLSDLKKIVTTLHGEGIKMSPKLYEKHKDHKWGELDDNQIKDIITEHNHLDYNSKPKYFVALYMEWMNRQFS